MAEALKNIYNPIFFEKLCSVLKCNIEDFDKQHFLNNVFNSQWPELELKQRVRQITVALKLFLPDDFKKTYVTLIRISNDLQKKGVKEQGFQFIFLADYVEVFGLENPEESIEALEEITKLVSAEFAVRKFLIHYPERMKEQMVLWSKHENANVRRLSSEGVRPRLPWAISVPFLKTDPETIFIILDNLKDDASEYVRRSVANNLNDIAKDHPQRILKFVKGWDLSNHNVSRIVKHGCRTLLKKGNDEALQLYGFNPNAKATVNQFALSSQAVKIGDTLNFDFTVENKEKALTDFRIEYAITFKTLSGKGGRKVFMICEKSLLPDEKILLKRKRSFRNLTIRKHYKGKHAISILINGRQLAEKEFTLR